MTQLLSRLLLICAFVAAAFASVAAYGQSTTLTEQLSTRGIKPLTPSNIDAVGGDPTARSSAQQAISATQALSAAVPKALTILVPGDSLGYGQGTSSPGPNGTTSWPSRLIVYLTTYMTPVAGGSGASVVVSVRNTSLGGSYSGTSFNRLTGNLQTDTPRLVLLMNTPNDARVDGGNANLLDTEANLRREVGLCRLYGATPVLITSPPIVGELYTPTGIYSSASQAKNVANNAIVRSLAAELGVQLIDVESALSANQGWTRTYAAVDGVHPGNTGADIIAQIIARALSAMPAVKFFGLDLATDGFARANSSTTLGGTESGALAWSALSGTWGISNNTAYMASGANGRSSVDSSVANHEVQADLLLGSAAAGVEARQVDASNALQFTYAGSGTFRLRISKVVGGAASALVSTNAYDGASALTGTHSLRLSVSGRALTGYLDGVPVLSYTLTTSEQATFGAATKAGLYSQTPGAAAASFDNFVVRSLSFNSVSALGFSLPANDNAREAQAA